MRGGGNQVGDVTRGLAIAFNNYRLHVRGVPPENIREYPGNDLLVAMQQVHLAIVDQRVIVLADVADSVALMLTTAVLPFALLHVVLRFGKSCDHLTILAYRVPATMIEVQVSINDHINVVGRYPAGAEILQQLRRLAVDLDHFF